MENPWWFYDLGNQVVSMLQGIKTKARQHIRKKNQNNSKRESQQEKWSEAKGARDNQGWARRVRDLDVRSGAAEGTAPWPCVGEY